MTKYEIDERYLSQYGFHNRAKTRQLARNLSPWCKERCGAYIGNLTLLKIKQHFIPTSFFFDTFDSRWLGLAAQKRFWLPLTISIHNGLL